MDERSEGGGRLIVFLLIAAMAVAIWLFRSRPAATEAVEEAIDPFVPAGGQFEARLDAVERARQVRDAINARTAQGPGAPE
jgi:hypothetical protein